MAPLHQADEHLEVTPGEGTALEDQIVKLALDGILAQSVHEIVRQQRESGIAVTFQRGDQIIKQFPDGTEQIIGQVQEIPYTLPADVRIFGQR